MLSSGILNQFTQQRSLNTTFKLLRVINLVIEQHKEVKQSCREEQTEQEAHHQNLRQFRLCARYIPLRHIYNLRRHRSGSKTQCVLLAFLIKEEVQLLLNLLITYCTYILTLLHRCIFNLTVVFRILCTQTALTYLQTLTNRTDRLKDVRTHGC